MHAPPVHRRSLRGLAARLASAAVLALVALTGLAAAQGVELATLKATRADGEVSVEFAVRVTLPRVVEEAMSRGVPVYFTAEARLRRSRWYWRDERVARVSRTWRLAFQPLTGSWRVGLGGLNQHHATLAEALASASRVAGWKLADAGRLDPDKDYYVEFEYRLDTAQLPSPMQFGLFTQGDWAVGVSRTVTVE